MRNYEKSIHETSKDILPERRQKPKKKLMLKEILKLKDKRKQNKHYKNEYDKINKDI